MGTTSQVGGEVKKKKKKKKEKKVSRQSSTCFNLDRILCRRRRNNICRL